MKHMFKYQTVVHNAKRLTQASDLFGIPVVSTEQMPKNFGHTIPELKAVNHPGVFKHEKSLFSMLEEPVKAHIKALSRQNVVLYGIEAHVCML